MTLIALFLLLVYMAILLFIYPRWYKNRHRGSIKPERRERASTGSSKHTTESTTSSERAKKRGSVIAQISVTQSRWVKNIAKQRGLGLTAGWWHSWNFSIFHYLLHYFLGALVRLCLNMTFGAIFPSQSYNPELTRDCNSGLQPREGNMALGFQAHKT